MNSFLVYMVKASLIMAILYLPFSIFWKNTTFFTLNRIYLLGSLVCSLIFPLLSITFHNEIEIKTLSLLLDPITIHPDKTAYSEQSVPVIRIIGALYISGTFTFIFLLLYRLAQVFMLIKQEGIRHTNEFKTVKLMGMHSPASFFKIIFIAEKDEYDEIYAHENVHIQQGHSFDILFVAFLKAMFWFNPVIWLYEISLKNLHEFLADAGTLEKGFNLLDYQRLMVEKTFGVQLNPLATNFNYSPLKKRLKMITKNKSGNRIKWLYLIAIPVFAIAFMVNINAQTSKSEKEVAPPPPPPPPESSIDKVIVGGEDIFNIVEEMPAFNNGNADDFRVYIGQNLKYPDVAAKKGIQGKVFVEFVIDKEGNVTNAKVVRGVDELLDTEALRVINSSPKWTPGKQKGETVNVKFTFPIVFALQ